MTPSTTTRLIHGAVITFALGISLAAGTDILVAKADSPYATFKLSGVMTDCVVPRLERPAGTAPAEVGPGGGEPLTDAEARSAYNCAKSQMSAAYAKSGNAAAQEYSKWSNFSTSPYSSAPHGNRYVNNYANAVSAPFYAKYEQGGVLPVGSVLVKDSFIVNADGRVVFGVLSLMEKMPAGFNPVFGDWRYTMIMPDGSEFGISGGMGSDKVAFCGGCHVAVEADQDSLFFVPLEHRFREPQR